MELESASEAAIRDLEALSIRQRVGNGPKYNFHQGVTVVVGKAPFQKLFLLHKGLVNQHSKFFDTALSKNWKENKESRVRLEEDDPEIFEVFVQFLYTGKIFTMDSMDSMTVKSSNSENASSYNEEWVRLTQCWILGDKLLSTSFKDAITDTTIAKLLSSHKFPLDMPRDIYKASSGACGIRKLMVDIAVWKWDDYHLSNSFKPEDPVDFYFDVALALKKVKQSNPTSGRPAYAQGCRCVYHDHLRTENCYKAMF